MSSKLHFGFPEEGKAIAFTASRELTVIEWSVIRCIVKNKGTGVLANVFTMLERLTGERPSIEVLTMAEFERRKKQERDAKGDDDASEAA